MRMPRKNVPGVVYHLIWRFVDRDWFFHDAEERGCYLRLLGRALEFVDWRCLAFALMSNHIHIAMVAGTSPMSSWTKRVNSPFARWMNERHGRLGSLMADRARDHAIVSAREGHLLAYIHNNPVRAGVVAHANQSGWTSHRFYAGLDAPPKWLHVDEGLARAGFVDMATFDAWVGVTPGESGVVEVERARRAAKKHGALEVATPVDGAPAMIPLVRRPTGHIRMDVNTVIKIAAEILHVSELLVRSRSRVDAAIAARFVTVRCGRALGISASEIAAALGISTSAVSQISDREPSPLARTVIQSVAERLEIEMVRPRAIAV
jgi:REP element-mobilizing transposase RayT